MNETTPPPPSHVAPATSPALLLQRPWTKGEVCDLLQISERTLDKLIDQAAFPAPIRLGGLAVLRWHGPAVLAWWQAQVAGSTTPSTSTPEPALGTRPVRDTGAGRPLGVVTRG